MQNTLVFYSLRLAAILILFVAQILCAPPALAKKLISERWYRLDANGTPIGFMQTKQFRSRDKLETRSHSEFTFLRNGVALSLQIDLLEIESLQLEPLEFEQRIKGAGSDVFTRGKKRTDGRWQFRQTTANTKMDRTIDYPSGAKLGEGLLALFKTKQREVGSKIAAEKIDPSFDQASNITAIWQGEESVQLPEQTLSLSKLEMTEKSAQGELTQTLWLDQDGMALRSTMPAFGAVFETLQCSKACATVRNTGFDLMQSSMLLSPRTLDLATRQNPLQYKVRIEGPKPIFPNSAEQSSRSVSETQFLVEIDPSASSVGRSSSDPNDSASAVIESNIGSNFLQSNAWIEREHVSIRQLLRKAKISSKDPKKTMTELEIFVRRFIVNKNLASGFASAVQTAQTRSGDCTEHGVLLAALGRASGIPTRLAAGLAYYETPDEKTKKNKAQFVPHLWTQAWIDGAWVSYDAALFGFDSGHLMLASSDGDPSALGFVLASIQNIEIESIESIP